MYSFIYLGPITRRFRLLLRRSRSDKIKFSKSLKQKYVSEKTEISSILFNPANSFEMKMTEIEKISRNMRLLLGFKSEKEFQLTTGQLAANGIELKGYKLYKRPNYFHALVKFQPQSKEAQDTLDILPYAFGEEIVPNDMTGLVDTGFESLGKTILDINHLPFDEQIDHFCKNQLGSNEESLMEKYFIQNLIYQTLKSKLTFDRFQLIPYGSTLSGFSNKFSDLDICLFDKEGRNYDDRNDNTKLWQNDAMNILSQLFQALNPDQQIRRAKFQYSKSIIPGISKQTLILAKHPIITCHYDYMNMEFDLSYSDPSLMEMSKLHNAYSSLSQNVLVFISILRIWAKINNITSHGSSNKLSPYILTQLALNYLQYSGIIPKFETMAANHFQKTKFLGMELGFTPPTNLDEYQETKTSQLKLDLTAQYLELDNIDHINQPDHFLVLFYGFLVYIKKFNPLVEFICSRTGSIKPKIRFNSTLVINHPFRKEINVAANVAAVDFLVFQRLCETEKEKIFSQILHPRLFPESAFLASNYPDLSKAPTFLKANTEQVQWKGLSLILNPYIRVNSKTKELYFTKDQVLFADEGTSKFFADEKIDLLQ